jgi:aminocarboxymuconate-semialdehyde decarboxylase
LGTLPTGGPRWVAKPGKGLNCMIDAHSHIYPLSYLEFLEKRDQAPRVLLRDGRREFIIFPEEDGPHGMGGRGMGAEFWRIEEKAAFMDAFGIDRTIVSLGNPWFDPFQGEDSLEWVRRVNDEMAGYEERTNGRIVALGSLPAVDVHSAVEEVNRVANKSGLYGVISGTRIAGHRLDDPALDEFWDRVSSLGLPVFLHPSTGVALDELGDYGLTLQVGIGFPVETTIALARLIFGRVLERFPTLKLVVAHGGGCLPHLSGRLDAVWRSDSEVHSKLRLPPSKQMSALYLDSLVYTEQALEVARSCVGEDHLLLGTDHPFLAADTQRSIDVVEESATDEGRERVFGRNAEELFGLNSQA